MDIKRTIAGVVVSIPMLINLIFFQISLSTGLDRVTGIIVSVFVLTILFLTVYTQNLYKYRRIFFIVVALTFFPSFIGNLIEARGQMSLSSGDIVKSEVPFCHIVIPFTIIPYALSDTIIFPARLFNHYASIYSMLLIWLLATVTLGRGWCSWVCFYGGWDEATSSIGKKSLLKVDSSKPFYRYFNFSILLGVGLLSLKSMSVIYCEWLCPFKLITEYSDSSTFFGYIQFIIMVVLFFGLLIILPILTKKRFQCATFCPFGAFQSLFSKISPFKMVIDKKKCNGCLKCVKICPMNSITKESINDGKILMTCSLCGKCIPECPQNAISLRFSFLSKVTRIVKGKYSEVFNLILSPTSFLAFIGFLIGSIIGGGFMKDSLARLITWVM